MRPPEQQFESDVQDESPSTLLLPPARLHGESLCVGLVPELASVIKSQLLPPSTISLPRESRTPLSQTSV